MCTKVERQQIIKDLISSEKIRSQEELQAKLQAKDLKVTQATLSRDLNEMGIVKIKDQQNGYCYRMPVMTRTAVPVHTGSLSDGIISIEASSHFCVIKTHPGFAAAVALLLDSNNIPEVMGTIAGDDTVLVITRDGNSKSHMLETLSSYLPGVSSKII